MRRNLAVTGGRQVKNEDFTQYIQAFSVLENLFSELNYGDFILTGCEITGPPFNISAGVVFAAGELCLVDAGAVTGTPTEYRTTKTRVGVNPREFQDTNTKNTAEDLKLLPDPAGVIDIATLPRAEDRFLRFEDSMLRAAIDTNNNALSNIWKPLLSDRSENLRRFPKPDGLSRYMKLGSFEREDSQVCTFQVVGGGLGVGSFSVLYFGKVDVLGEVIVGNQTQFMVSSDTDPEFFYKVLPTQIQLWIKSPSVNVFSLPLLSGVIAESGEAFSDDDNPFEFDSSFSWSATDPGGLVSFRKNSVEDNKRASEDNAADIATNAADIATNAANIITNAQNIANNTSDIGGVKTKKVDIGVWDMQSAVSVIVSTGVSLSKIIGVSCLIQTDSGTTRTPIDYADTAGVVDGSIFVSASGDCVASRRTGGAFDTSLYSGSGNRGFIIVNYID